MENYGEESNQISKYNDGWLSIQRLNESWLLCKSFIRNSQYKKWKVELDNVFMELYTDIMR